MRGVGDIEFGLDDPLSDDIFFSANISLSMIPISGAIIGCRMAPAPAMRVVIPAPGTRDRKTGPRVREERRWGVPGAHALPLLLLLISTPTPSIRAWQLHSPSSSWDHDLYLASTGIPPHASTAMGIQPQASFLSRGAAAAGARSVFGGDERGRRVHRAATEDPAAATPATSPPNTIHYLFQVYEKINNEGVWAAYFKQGHQVQNASSTLFENPSYSVFIHCKDRASAGCTAPTQFNATLVTSVPSSYCTDLVSPMVQLLRSAQLVAKAGDHFVFVSDSSYERGNYSPADHSYVIRLGVQKKSYVAQGGFVASRRPPRRLLVACRWEGSRGRGGCGHPYYSSVGYLRWVVWMDVSREGLY